MSVTAREVVAAVEEVLEAALACCADDEGLCTCFFCGRGIGKSSESDPPQCEGPTNCLGADLRKAVKTLQELGGARVGQSPSTNETKKEGDE